MFVTHSFLGVKKGQLKYLFFLVIEDYIYEQRALKEQLDPLLDDFGRNLLNHGAIVKSFEKDVLNTLKEVEDKWKQRDLRDVVFFNQNNQMPGLLLIDKSFEKFNPKKHQWLYISFREYINEFGQVKIFDLRELLNTLAKICNSKENLFDEAKRYLQKRETHKLHKIVEIKPEIFGVSLDVKEAINFVKHWKDKYQQ